MLTLKNVETFDLTAEGRTLKQVQIVMQHHYLILTWHHPDGLVAFPAGYCEASLYGNVTDNYIGSHSNGVLDVLGETVVRSNPIWAHSQKSGVMMAARYFVERFNADLRKTANTKAVKRALLKGGTGDDKPLFSLPAA